MNADTEKTIETINAFLAKKQYKEICDIFTNSFMNEIDNDELAYISLYTIIYKDELKHGTNPTSFELGETIEDLIKIFRQLKFLLWEYEFDNNEESTNDLVTFICSYGISAEYLNAVVMTSSVNKELVLSKLAKLFS